MAKKTNKKNCKHRAAAAKSLGHTVTGRGARKGQRQESEGGFGC